MRRERRTILLIVTASVAWMLFGALVVLLAWGSGCTASPHMLDVIVDHAMPPGLVIVLLVLIWLSHRREMQRLKRNSIGKKQERSDEAG